MPTFTLWMGVNICELITNFCSIQPGLKWPNDIMIGSRKCGGVLTEIQWMGGSASSAIIGIGINLKHETSDFPLTIQNSATSLKMEGWLEPDRDVFLEALTHDFFQNLDLLDNPMDLIDAWNSMAWKLNKSVQFRSKDQSFEGEFLGITHHGEAKILVENRVQVFRNGEIRLSDQT